MATWLAKFRAGFGAKDHITGTGGSSWWWSPAGAVDLSGVGDGGNNSAVFACLRVKSKGFTEAPARVFDREDRQWIEIPGHPISRLLSRPNPYMTSTQIGAYTIYSIDVSGDAYFAKIRSAAGLVVQLWPLRPDLVQAIAGEELGTAQLEQVGAESTDFIAAYRYTPDTQEVLFPRSEIVHLRDMPDPVDPRHGAAAIKTVLREILADEEAGQFAASLVKNMGVPGVILTPEDPEDAGPDEEEAEDIKSAFRDNFGGDNRGKPMVMTGGKMRVNVVSFSPEQLDFKTVRRLPEERISAVTGVPAILAGLGAGLDRSTYANVQQARESMAEDTLSSLWQSFGVQWTEQLGPDFGLTESQAIRYDTSEVRSLQPDKDKTVTRMNTAILGGWATVGEGRAELGLNVEPWHDVFLRSAAVLEEPNEMDSLEDPTSEPDPDPDPSSNGQVDEDELDEILT